jgi:hypothetical protein
VILPEITPMKIKSIIYSFNISFSWIAALFTVAVSILFFDHNAEFNKAGKPGINPKKSKKIMKKSLDKEVRQGKGFL